MERDTGCGVIYMNYLYNGIPLPNVNEVWTDDLKAEYPNAAITLASGIYYFSYYSTTPTANQHEVIAGASGRTYQATSGESTWTKSSAAAAITPRKPVWSNYDIYYADDVADVGGTLYLAATDPVPVGTPITDPLSFAMGWQLGQRLRMRGKKPVAYLYNGVFIEGELPKYDTKQYRNAVIVKQTFPFAKSGNWLAAWGDETESTGNAATTARKAPIQYRSNNSAWETDTMASNAIGTLIWCNHDFYNASGELQMEASDPVPVYKGIVAYEYNGVRLPEIPDRGSNDVIFYRKSVNKYFLMRYTEILYVTDYTSVSEGEYGIGLGIPISYASISEGETSWGELKDWSADNPNNTGIEVSKSELIWSGSNIYHDDEIIFDFNLPVAVYE